MTFKHDEVKMGDVVMTPGYPWTTWNITGVTRNERGTVTHLTMSLPGDTYSKRITAGQFNSNKYDLVKLGR